MRLIGCRGKKKPGRWEPQRAVAGFGGLGGGGLGFGCCMALVRFSPLPTASEGRIAAPLNG
jgi:hypothetical protein